MKWSNYWKVFQQANQGICVFNSKLESVYANKMAMRAFVSMAPELCQKLKGICRRFMTMVKVREASFPNYNGMLNHQYEFIRFSLFSFCSVDQAFIMVVFDYQVSNETDLTGEVTFTSREKDILKAIAAGKTNKEISELLSISFETVKSHVRNLLAKTATRSRAELISKNWHLKN